MARKKKRKPDFIITINTDRNADWIRYVPGYKEAEDKAHAGALRIHKERLKKEQDKKP